LGFLVELPLPHALELRGLLPVAEHGELLIPLVELSVIKLLVSLMLEVVMA
jgi:hypothetical protein